MGLSRRQAVQGILAGTAATAAGLRPRWSRAEVQIGEATIQTLSDGHLTLPPEFIFGPMPQEELGPVLQASGISTDAPLRPECNLTLLRRGDALVLFDAGAGPAFQDSAGRLADALDAAGVAPGDVTHVIFTHGHPDHLWGVLDDFDDPYFPGAAHFIGRTEWEYWTDPATVDTIGPARTAFAVGAQRRLAAMEDSMAFFEDGEELLPGIAARTTPGHTPGHMSFEIRAGSESLMIVGDAIGNHHVAFARPDWPSGSDQDQDLAAATRVALMEQLAGEKIRLVGFHLPQGGLGRVERAGGGYRFVPDGD